MEAELAEWVQEHESRLPIVAFMAGRFMDEMQGMRFGHAGTIVEGKEDTTAEKIERMRGRRDLGRRAHRGDPGAASAAARGERSSHARSLHRREGRPEGREGSRASRAKLDEVCPVGIFDAGEERACTIVEKNLDECTLCDLCHRGRAEGQRQDRSSSTNPSQARRSSRLTRDSPDIPQPRPREATGATTCEAPRTSSSPSPSVPRRRCARSPSGPRG